jgi:hypothetical protein
MDLGDIGCGNVHQIGWAQDKEIWKALVNAVANFRVP